MPPIALRFLQPCVSSCTSRVVSALRLQIHGALKPETYRHPKPQGPEATLQCHYKPRIAEPWNTAPTLKPIQGPKPGTPKPQTQAATRSVPSSGRPRLLKAKAHIHFGFRLSSFEGLKPPAASPPPPKDPTFLILLCGLELECMAEACSAPPARVVQVIADEHGIDPTGAQSCVNVASSCCVDA